MRRLIQRRIFVGLLIILQVVFLLYTVLSTSGKHWWINWVLSGISLWVALYIISRREKAAYRMTWIFQILVFPLFGGLFYLLFRFQSSTRRFRKGLAEAADRHFDAGFDRRQARQQRGPLLIEGERARFGVARRKVGLNHAEECSTKGRACAASNRAQRNSKSDLTSSHESEATVSFKSLISFRISKRILNRPSRSWS